MLRLIFVCPSTLSALNGKMTAGICVILGLCFAYENIVWLAKKGIFFLIGDVAKDSLPLFIWDRLWKLKLVVSNSCIVVFVVFIFDPNALL